MLLALWEDFIKSVASEKGETPVIESILRQLTPTELTEDKIVLRCENQGFKFFIQKRIPAIERRLEKFLKKKVTLEIVVIPTLKKKTGDNTPLLSYQPSIDDVFRKAGLHGSASFDNFAVSRTNQVAFAASKSISENLGHVYNPLFLWGSVGVGKTHLAQSVARHILASDTAKRVYFCPGDQFTNELVDGIRQKSMAKFRQKYRHLDLLIIDDVQFIAGKVSVQEEIFHTFNAIVTTGGQIILTSDKPPTAIKNLEDRLRSRFSGGLTVDVQSPDFELRTAILLIKAQEKNIELEIEAAKVIAEQVTDSRALEGSLLSLYAQSLGGNQRVDLDEIEQYFKTKKNGAVKKIGPQDIILAVCTYYNLKQSQIKGAGRSEHIARARQVAMFLLRRDLKLKLEEVALLLKRKDHTTVMHGVKKVVQIMTHDQTFKEEVDAITRSLSFSTPYSL